LPSTCDSTWQDRERFLLAFQRLQDDCGTTIDELLAQIDREFGDFAPIMKLAQPAKSLAAYLQPEAVVA
jgi:hypothetical protein